MNTIKHILALTAIASVAIPVAIAEITENGTGIPYGKGHAHFLTAPPGWVLDTESGAGQGVYTVFYPKGSDWNGLVAAYSNANGRDGRTTEQVIASDIAALRKPSPSLKVTNGGTITTLDGKQALVRYFVNDVRGNSEAVAYVPEKDVVINIVMTARNEAAFGLSMPAFRKLVSSYEWITGDPEHVDFVKLAHEKRPKPFHFPPDNKTVTKIVCNISGQSGNATMVVYMSGTMFQRVEIADSPKGPFRTKGIVNEPDLWGIDNDKHVAQHMKDSGPIYGAVLPIVAELASKPEGPLDGLQFGHEVDFFQRYGERAKTGEWSARVDGVDLKLWLKQGTTTPSRMVAKKGGRTVTVEYVSYQTGLPFDAKLFSVPAGMKVVEGAHSVEGH